MPASRRKVETYYDVLGVSPDAGPAELRDGFFAKARAAQLSWPARLEEFRRLRRAYNVLSDAGERRRYDLTLGLGDYAARRRYRRRCERVLESLRARLPRAEEGALRFDGLRERTRRRAG